MEFTGVSETAMHETYAVFLSSQLSDVTNQCSLRAETNAILSVQHSRTLRKLTRTQSGSAERDG